MFEIGDYLIYGNNGVCKVEDVGQLDISGISKDKLYYTLNPVYSGGSKIFTPVDNDKVIMRKIITKEDANNLIKEIKDIDILGITNEKHREESYKEALKTCDCRELARVIKTIYIRKKVRNDQGKKVIASDEKYFRLAEDNLYGELAITLDMDRSEVKEYIEAAAGGQM